LTINDLTVKQRTKVIDYYYSKPLTGNVLRKHSFIQGGAKNWNIFSAATVTIKYKTQ